MNSPESPVAGHLGHRIGPPCAGLFFAQSEFSDAPLPIFLPDTGSNSDALPGKLPIARIHAGRQTGPKLTTGTEKWKSLTSSKPWISTRSTPRTSTSWPTGSMSLRSARPPRCWSAPGTSSPRHPARLESSAGESDQDPADRDGASRFRPGVADRLVNRRRPARPANVRAFFSGAEIARLIASKAQSFGKLELKQREQLR